MRNTLFYMLVAFATLGLSGCHDDPDPVPFDIGLLEGDWYAEIPLSGSTENMRLEEGGVTDYDHVGVVLRFTYSFTSGYWIHLFLHDGEMVNFSGFGFDDETDGTFDYTVSPDGEIAISHFLAGTPRPEGIRYVDGRIYAVIGSQTVVFSRPNDEQSALLQEVEAILIEQGDIGGAEDGGTKYDTDISDKNATNPARSRRG